MTPAFPAADIGSSKTVGERVGIPAGRLMSTWDTAPWIMPLGPHPPPTSTPLPAKRITPARWPRPHGTAERALGRWANATKWNSGAYAWETRKPAATFGGTGGAVTLSGTVIAHGVTISSGATGYTFSGGALTVTAGGITANESATFNSPISVGAPQTWTVASGKTLTVGDLHTIISPLTISGAGNTTITGTIDGGGVPTSMEGPRRATSPKRARGASDSQRAPRITAATSRPCPRARSISSQPSWRPGDL